MFLQEGQTPFGRNWKSGSFYSSGPGIKIQLRALKAAVLFDNSSNKHEFKGVAPLSKAVVIFFLDKSARKSKQV
jgi:hypothetical protein